MKKASIALAALALATIPAEAIMEAGSVGRMTLGLRLTTPGTSQEVANGTRQSLSTTRFGNRELLTLLAERSLIPSIQGYTLAEFFYNDGESMYYGAYNSKTGHSVYIPFDILESLESNGVSAVSINTRNESLTVVAKVQTSATLCDSALSIFQTITASSATGKLDGEPYPFMAVSSVGTLHGSNEDRDFVVEGNINVARSTIFIDLR
jgi:hypothetical protein